MPYGRPPPSYQTPAVPQPKPIGTPSRAWFTVGAIGHFFSVAASIAFGVYLLDFYFYPSVLMLILGILLFVAVLLQLFAFAGMRQNYGSLMGAATFGYGLAAILFFLVAAIVVQLPMVRYNWYGPLLGLVLIIISWIALGVLFILEGVAYIVTRGFMGIPGASVAVGVLLIVGGSMISSVILAIFGGFFVLVPGFILGGILLLRAPLPAGSAAFPP